MFQLFRTYLEDKTVGQLVFPNGDSVYTLERPWLDNKPFFSCIPEDTYVAERDHFGKHQWYSVLNVPNRSFIEIHPVTYVNQLEGCIGLGMELKNGVLYRSTEACQKLLDFHGESSFLLEIKEDKLGEYTPKM